MLGDARVRVRLYGQRAYRDVEMLVDTGAIFTKISASLAMDIGVVPDEAVRMKLADGTVREAGVGEAKIEMET